MLRASGPCDEGASDTYARVCILDVVPMKWIEVVVDAEVDRQHKI